MAHTKPLHRAAAGTPNAIRLTRSRLGLVVTLGLATGIAALPMNTSAAPETTAAAAQSGEVKRYAIDPGPLSEVLSTFAGTAGVTLSFDASLLKGRTSDGLQGNFSVDRGFAKLLDGSGIVHRFTGAETVILAPVPDDGPLQLSPILVRGEAGDGAVEGFRAERSSSATNVDAPLIQTPATVNVATEDFIDTIGARRIEEVLQYVPGTSVQAVAAAGTAFNMRGFSIEVFGGLATGEGSLQIDNYRPAARRYHFDPVLYERIDVLKGSAALLYGTASPGGVIRFVTKKPQFERRHRFEATLGSFETTRGTIDLTGPFADDGNVAYRLIASGLTSNQSFHGDNDDISFDDRLIINPQLAWRTPSGGELRLSYEYSQHENALDPGIKRLTGGTFTFNTEPFLGPDSSIDRENHIGVMEFTQPIGDNWELLIGGSIGRSDVRDLTDTSFGNPDASNNLDRNTRLTDTDFEHEGFRAELSGEFNTGSLLRHQITLGGSYFSSENFSYRKSAFTPGAIDALNPVFGPAPPLDNGFSIDSGLEEYAVYLQDYISVGDRLKLFGGLRYTDANGEAIIPAFAIFSEGSDTAFDYTVGAIYNQNHWFNPFISYSTALVPQVGALSDNPGPIPFSEGEQIEAGLKSEWLGGRLATTASIFRIEQTDIVEDDPAGTAFSVLVGDQRTRGFEFEAVGRITDQITLLGGYSYLDAEFTGGANAGATPHNVPEHKVSLFGQYEFVGELTGWRAGFGFVHVGERQGNNANTFKLPTYERVDTFIGYERGGFDLRLAIENVLDEDYIIGSDGFSNSAQGAPRFFTLTVGYEFN